MGINEYKEKKFETQLGQKATVKREELENDRKLQLNEVLRDIAKDIKPQGVGEYKGSFAVHVFVSEILGELAYVTQVCPDKTCNPMIASKAIVALTKDTQRALGITPQTKRSGW